MKLSIQAASTSQTVNVFVQDSSSTTGAGLTGLVFNSAGLTAYYALPKAAAVSITLATLAAVTSAYSSGGFKEIDATNMPGWYRFDVPDAALASGRFVSIHLKGATSMAPLPLEIELTAWNNQDAVRGGMTALPNANAGATNGLPLSVDSSGRVDVLKINGTSQTARDIGASVLLSAGTGTGQLDFTSGVVKSNLAQILGTALTETAGQIAAGFKQFFNVGLPAGTINVIPRVTLVDTATALSGNTAQTGDCYARLGAPAGASHAADVAAVKTDTGNLRTDYTTARAAKLDNLDATVSSRGTGDATASSQTAISASIAALPSAATIADTTLARALPAESYAANGVVPTLGQMLYMLWSAIANCGVVGTTITTLKLDRATTSMTFTTDDGTSPTRRTRTT